MLDQVTRGVGLFLDRRRARIPRLFLLSDDEILSFFSTAATPAGMQQFLPKLFGNVRSALLNDEGCVVGFTSPDGGDLPFLKPVKPGPTADAFLIALVQASQDGLRTLVRQALRAVYRQSLQDWIMEWPTQSALAASSVAFTNATEVSVDSGRGDCSGSRQESRAAALSSLPCCVSTMCTMGAHSIPYSD